ncbi:MAG: bifunctional tetrahydrofolate synthase/dihydrofolate synthase [Pseudomonadota bacterium]
MKFNTLDEWLSWQESLNPREIDLGLERISSVLAQTGLNTSFDCPLITVAGTNGKGSVVAFIEAIAIAAGYTTGAYTSPHLLRYNERIRINGEAVDDARLCESFDRIDRARDKVPLTYFEFGTLAAIDIFASAKPDLVIMEVGLGGRLDAVNCMDPDVSVITSIAIDHVDWLGDNRESIGFEKAGIMRAGKLTVCGDADPPNSLLEHAAELNSDLKVLCRDYRVKHSNETWDLLGDDTGIDALPVPALTGEFQYGNAATAITALNCLQGMVFTREAIEQGLKSASLPGRYQKVQSKPLVLLDVAHNVQAVASLVAQLQTNPVRGKTHAVIAMLADKPVEQVIELASVVVDDWYSAGLESIPRGFSASAMAASVERQVPNVKLSAASTVSEACAQALAVAAEDDRVIVFGSFYTVAEAMAYFDNT